MEKLRGVKKDGTWDYLAPDVMTKTDNGVEYNLREMQDLINEKRRFLAERFAELKKIEPAHKEPRIYSKHKRRFRLRRPTFQASRPKARKTEKEKEKEAEKGKGKAKAKDSGKGAAAAGKGGKGPR